jgi:hypothetical protein
MIYLTIYEIYGNFERQNITYSFSKPNKNKSVCLTFLRRKKQKLR